MPTPEVTKAIAELAKWLVGGLAWLGSNFLAYRLGKQSKVDEIRIRRVCELAEQIAVTLQSDHREREVLLNWFKANFEHARDLNEGLELFGKHDLLYRGERERILALRESVNKLVKLRQEATLYLPRAILEGLDDYVRTTEFTFMSDGPVGWINTYFEGFFTNLHDEANSRKQMRTYDAAIRGLAKVKP